MRQFKLFTINIESEPYANYTWWTNLIAYLTSIDANNVARETSANELLATFSAKTYSMWKKDYSEYTRIVEFEDDDLYTEFMLRWS